MKKGVRVHIFLKQIGASSPDHWVAQRNLDLHVLKRLKSFSLLVSLHAFLNGYQRARKDKVLFFIVIT